MDKLLDIPKDRTRLPIGRLCLILGLTILLLLTTLGRKPTALAELSAALFGLA